MNRTRQIRVLSLLAAFVLAFLGIAGPAQAANIPAQNAPTLGGGKVTICHHPQGQPPGVYNYQSVSTSSVFGGNGHDSHQGDVVPPFEGYAGSATWREDPVRAAQFLANGCADAPPTTSPAPTPCPTTDTPTPSPTTDTPTPSPTTGTPTTGAPTPDPTTGSPTTDPTTGAPTTGTPTTGPTTGIATQGGSGGGGAAGGGGGAANCTCPDIAAAISAAAAAGQPVGTIGPDGSVVDPISGNTVRPCPQVLADTGIESSGLPAGMTVLGIGTLVAGVAVLVLTLLPRGRHS